MTAKLYCYYRPAGEGSTKGSGTSAPSYGGLPVDFGHFLLEVEIFGSGKKIAFDYFPEGDNPIVKTQIDDVRRQQHYYISFWIPDESAKSIVHQIELWRTNPPKYEFPSDSTCVSRSIQLLSLANMITNDESVTPGGLFYSVTKQSGRDHSDQRLEIQGPHGEIPQGGVWFPPGTGEKDAGPPEDETSEATSTSPASMTASSTTEGQDSGLPDDEPDFIFPPQDIYRSGQGTDSGGQGEANDEPDFIFAPQDIYRSGQGPDFVSRNKADDEPDNPFPHLANEEIHQRAPQGEILDNPPNGDDEDEDDDGDDLDNPFPFDTPMGPGG